jgi:predicted NBD/HSP70 family sugar kinase
MTDDLPDMFSAEVLRTVLDAGGLSRAEISRRLRVRPNTVSETVESMIDQRWLREALLTKADESNGQRRGRPAVRVEIDPDGRRVLGLAIRPGHVEAAQLDLLGQPVGLPVSRRLNSPKRIAQTAAVLLRNQVEDATACIGVSYPGFFDDRRMSLLFSSIAPHQKQVSLEALRRSAGAVPLVMEHDTHAWGDRWRLSHPEASEQTVMLIRIGDGAIGASIMVGGAPADRGVIPGGSELGHVQIAAEGLDVPDCYCGQPRCLEQAFSSKMVGRLTGKRQRLATLLGAVGKSNDLEVSDSKEIANGQMVMAWLTDRLAEAVANAIHLIRPHRVIWSGIGPMNDLLSELEPSLNQAVNQRLLPVLQGRVVFEHWPLGQRDNDATTAGHLALATVMGRRAVTKA